MAGKIQWEAVFSVQRTWNDSMKSFMKSIFFSSSCCGIATAEVAPGWIYCSINGVSICSKIGFLSSPPRSGSSTNVKIKTPRRMPPPAIILYADYHP